MTFRVYVGTDAKYNNGSLYGQWLGPSDYLNVDDFYAGCRELHKDEPDPEYMFQDWKGLPSSLIGESWISADLWNYFALLDHYSEEVIVAAMELEIPADQVDGTSQGQWDSWTEFDYEWIESTGTLDTVPEEIARNFDYESFGRDLAFYYSEANGHVVSNG